jgi:RHS repeat-associated protein
MCRLRDPITSPAARRLRTGTQRRRGTSRHAAGNLTSEGTFAAHTYDAAGRRTGTTDNGVTWSYAYNALGQRLKKASPSSVRLFAYDEAGRLLGEYDAAGKLVQEIVWLDDIPVASLRLPAGASSGPAEVFYIHADHLNTPRRISRPSDNQVMWQWQGEAFGHSLPDENPQGAGAFANNLRMPGQYFDAETGLFYNYFRDYDPSVGRYVQSDPIGLAGGVNTYGYVGGNPISKVDPRGLDNPGMGPYGPGPCNGCGSGWNEPLIPDLFPAACNRHDYCYGTYGRSKWSCDKQFWKDSFAESGPWPILVTPTIYFLGPFLFGGSAYKEAQAAALR